MKASDHNDEVGNTQFICLSKRLKPLYQLKMSFQLVAVINVHRNLSNFVSCKQSKQYPRMASFQRSQSDSTIKIFLLPFLAPNFLRHTQKSLSQSQTLITTMAGVLHTTTAFPNSTPYTSKSISRSLIRASVKVKANDCEIRVSESRLHNKFMQFSAHVKEGSDLKSSKEEEIKRNYYVNVGYAIRSLRDEFPDVFYKEISFGIYRNDIVFKDPLNTFVGIENYKSIFWALRFNGRIFFKALRVEIIRVWQPVDSVIMVRWVIHGIARVPWEAQGRFDGTSEYKLDKNGKIYEHRVNNIAINSPPKFQVPAIEQLIQSISGSTPKPTYFEDSPSSILDYDLLLIQLAAMRSFMAEMLSTSDVQKCEEHS